MERLLIKNIGLLQTPEGSFSHKGEQQGQNLKLKDASIYAEDGIIKEITADGKSPAGAADTVKGSIDGDSRCQVIDAGGDLVTPGLVEGHTHMVFGGYRQHEIPMKLKDIGWPDRDVFITLVNRIQDITVTHNLIFIPISWSGFLLKKLLHTSACRDDAFNFIGCLRTLYLCDFNQAIQLHRLLTDE